MTGPALRAALVVAAALVVPATAAGAVAPAAPPAGRSIAITIDDLPGAGENTPLARLREIHRGIIEALARARAPAIGFVNEARLNVDGERDARAGLLRGWLDAGLDLGNHGYAHRGLTRTPLAEYEDDVVRGDVITRSLLAGRGRRPLFYRHPYTQTGPTQEIKAAFEAFLRERGYRVAPFTVEDADYLFDALYEDARATGDTARAAEVIGAYTAHQARMLDWFEGLARDLFGRDIPQVLLIHASGINAVTLPARLAALMERGYRFTTLEEALADPAYSTPDAYVGANGPSWLHRWSVAKGAPVRLRDEPDPPAWALEAWRAIEKRRVAAP